MPLIRFAPVEARRVFREMAVHLLYKTYEREPDPFTKRAVKMLVPILSAGYLEGLPLFPYVANLIHLGPYAIAKRLQSLSENVTTQVTG